MDKHKAYSESGLKFTLVSYRSLGADVIAHSIQLAVPESENFENRFVLSGWNSLLNFVPYVVNVEPVDNDVELNDDAQLIVEFWQQAKPLIQSGEWREVWQVYQEMSYEALLVLANAVKNTRREIIGLENPALGGSDNKNPLPLKQENAL